MGLRALDSPTLRHDRAEPAGSGSRKDVNGSQSTAVEGLAVDWGADCRGQDDCACWSDPAGQMQVGESGAGELANLSLLLTSEPAQASFVNPGTGSAHEVRATGTEEQ